ncbi:protein-tyrosine phosphatase-like protein [Zopfochytrium polystomum]|nr:protein-tyrosine phosphatase-like protein [Zopfochytrium polystomum]
MPGVEPRTSKTHPINISWLLPPELIDPALPNSYVSTFSRPQTVPLKGGPQDMLDMLGFSASQYPKGRAPSNSGFVGGFPVARAVTSSGAVIGVGGGVVLEQADERALASFQSRFVGGPTSNGTSAWLFPANPQAPAVPSVSASSFSTVFSAAPSFSTTNNSNNNNYNTTPSSSVTNGQNGSVASSFFNYSSAPSAQLPSEFDTVTDGNGGREQMEEMEAAGLDTGATTKQPTHGNFALSSCPGKKVRLNTGPVNGRASINRDLDTDFERLASFDIKTVVCCLNDAEMSHLGAPWPKYYEVAQKYGMEVIRIPIIEGSCPDTIEEVEPIIDHLDKRLSEGANILCHCRGGVGRAGLIACCVLLKRRYVLTAERAIQFVRLRRSLKAIETARQEDFVRHYEAALRAREREQARIMETD